MSARILIVEDSPLNLTLLRDFLGAQGFEIVEATTGEVGIELARGGGIDLVLMDVALPGMSGIEALAVLKGDPATASLPVIAVTASAMPQERATILGAGFDGYQAKPISVRDLLVEIDAVLGRSG